MEKAQKLQEEIKKVFGETPVYLVGGSVRDIVLGREPKDWDYCTPLDPDAIEAAVKAAGRKAYATGKRFGTIGFKVRYDNRWEYIEVTTYRTEVYDGKSRKPTVEFTDDLDLDLSRRDLTINAMVLKDNGEIYDPFGGRLDILKRHIKTVGMPKDRIAEDPLRMLRVARFASQLRFGVDPNIVGKMRQLGPSIYIVSKERWVQELDKLLVGAEPMKGIKILMQSELMKYVLPEVYLSLQDEDAYETLSVMMESGKDAPVDEKWMMLFTFIGFPYTYKEERGKVTFVNNEAIRKELLEGICARLKFSNERRDFLLKNFTKKY